MLGDELLHAALTEEALPQLIAEAYVVGGVELRYRHQLGAPCQACADFVEPCREFVFT